jgi:large subunit ribosomal protein L4
MTGIVPVLEPAEDSDSLAKPRTVELPGAVFDAATNVPLIHQVVVAQLAAARQGTASTKTRAEVAGGGKKPYRQKGTGRARQGSTRAPQFTGGGIVHGPKPRSYDQRTPKKMKAAALCGALSDRARNDRVHVVAGLVAGDQPSTRAAATALAKVTEARRVLVVALRDDLLTWLSLRNNAAVHILEPGQLNAYDVLVSDDVVFTEGALAEFLDGPVAARAASSRRAGLIEAIEEVVAEAIGEAVIEAIEEAVVEEVLVEAIEEAVIEAAVEEAVIEAIEEAVVEEAVAEAIEEAAQTLAAETASADDSGERSDDSEVQ